MNSIITPTVVYMFMYHTLYQWAFVSAQVPFMSLAKGHTTGSKGHCAPCKKPLGERCLEVYMYHTPTIHTHMDNTCTCTCMYHTSQICTFIRVLLIYPYPRNLSSDDIAIPVTGPVVSSDWTISQKGLRKVVTSRSARWWVRLRMSRRV